MFERPSLHFVYCIYWRCDHQMLAVLEGWAVMGRPQQTLLQLPVLVTSHQWPGHWSNNNSARPPQPRYGGGGMYEWGYNAHFLPSNCCGEVLQHLASFASALALVLLLHLYFLFTFMDHLCLILIL